MFMGKYITKERLIEILDNTEGATYLYQNSINFDDSSDWMFSEQVDVSQIRWQRAHNIIDVRWYVLHSSPNSKIFNRVYAGCCARVHLDTFEIEYLNVVPLMDPFRENVPYPVFPEILFPPMCSDDLKEYVHEILDILEEIHHDRYGYPEKSIKQKSCEEAAATECDDSHRLSQDCFKHWCYIFFSQKFSYHELMKFIRDDDYKIQAHMPTKNSDELHYYGTNTILYKWYMFSPKNFEKVRNFVLNKTNLFDKESSEYYFVLDNKNMTYEIFVSI